MEKNIAVDTSLINAISPVGLGFEKNSIEIGENVATACGIIKYPAKLPVGWLGKLTTISKTVAAVSFHPIEETELIEAISKNIKYDTGIAMNSRNAFERSKAEAAIEDGEEMLRRLDRNNERVGNVSVLIMPFAKDNEELSKVFRKVQTEAAVLQCRLRRLPFQQKEAFKFLSPSSAGSEKIEEILGRVMPLSTFVGGFPFLGNGFNDYNGSYFAKDNTGSFVVLDIWKRGDDRTNSNIVVMGDSGVGKSATVKHIAISEFMNDTKIIIIDPESEYKQLCKNLGGDWINASGGSSIINPFEIKREPKDDEDEEALNCGLQGHIKTLELFFELYLQGVTKEHIAIIKKSLIEMYKKFGIDFGTDTSSFTSDDYPTFSDFYEVLKARENNEEDSNIRSIYSQLLLYLTDAVTGADSFIWNGKTSIKADSDFICFDTSLLQSVSDSVKRTQYFNILTYAWNLLSENKSQRVLLICDEAYLMIDERVPQSMVYLRNAMKRARKYEAGICIISHSVTDFLAENIKQYGQALLDIPCYKIVFGSDGQNLRETANLYNLTEAEEDLLLEKQRSKALFFAGSKRMKVVFDIPEYKFEYFGNSGGR